MKKIVFLIGSLGSGGAERQMTTIACLLSEKGYDVSFLCYHNDDFNKHYLDSKGILVKVVSYKTTISKIFRLWKEIRQSNCDVVISMLSSPNFYALLTGLGAKHKVIIGLRGVPDLPNGNYGKDARLAWRANCIVSNSENAKDVWLKTYPKHKDKFNVIYNTVNISNCNSDYHFKRDGSLHICVPASFYSVKNPQGVIAALSKMTKEERDGINIDWYGLPEGELDEETQSLINKIKEAGVDDVLKVYKKTASISNVIKEADIVGLFSQREGLPNAICEGMMLGKPILMSRMSDYTVLVDSSNGLLCDANDPFSIKNAILKYKKMSEADLIQMGVNSKRKADALFSEERVLQKWIDIIES